MNRAFTALSIGIFLSAFSQVLLKSGARHKATWLASFLNMHTVIGYSLFVLVTVLNVYAMQTIPLKTVTAWVSLTYVLTLLMSRYLLKETLNGRMLIGAGMIVAGIVLFSSHGMY